VLTVIALLKNAEKAPLQKHVLTVLGMNVVVGLLLTKTMNRNHHFNLKKLNPPEKFSLILTRHF